MLAFAPNACLMPVQALIADRGILCCGITVQRVNNFQNLGRSIGMVDKNQHIRTFVRHDAPSIRHEWLDPFNQLFDGNGFDLHYVSCQKGLLVGAIC
jgi:hypothetical protein